MTAMTSLKSEDIRYFRRRFVLVFYSFISLHLKNKTPQTIASVIFPRPGQKIDVPVERGFINEAKQKLIRKAQRAGRIVPLISKILAASPGHQVSIYPPAFNIG
ncbi:hypothetical protein J1781_23230 [Rahnella sp. C60]|uniref:hypothetical protein n=1 Tax=Rahnella perminowiae TaxID=2816244 RepID=UPI001C27E0E9|nr:hypothetical protein [Rahnella perminowiae]MBU9809928.1 hypothetical protein [Rahnella perminowiae]MBU9817746.1 hypothetical protein [Rahnella perminowiae]